MSDDRIKNLFIEWYSVGYYKWLMTKLHLMCINRSSFIRALVLPLNCYIDIKFLCKLNVKYYFFTVTYVGIVRIIRFHETCRIHRVVKILALVRTDTQYLQ